MDIHADIIHKLQESNEILKEKYAQSHRKKEPFRQKLIKEADVFRQMQHIHKEDLVRSLSGKKLAGTDGSVNQTKGESPHIIYLFQAVAKTTDGIAKWTSDLFVPLLEREEEEDGISKQRAKRLATLELNAARTLIEEEEVAVMLMDGALYHYRIDAKEEWEQLRQSALSRGTLLIGVSEEITTENLIKLSSFDSYARNPYSYDRDLLFGMLEQNEMIYIDAIQHKAGLLSAWMRLGSTPTITGFDMLEEQSEHMSWVGDLICTLTPADGRGIPLWLDHIDQEIRITDKLVEGLVEQYVDEDIRKQFYVKMRTERPY
ncbi:DNA double-strand break repair nuclease NurA [Shouchella sp. JSM 1781072]|uniref:DNA double-strand break repair nuclease NurA n=1 Tax=Bacillaceae TaxID=186817 RepID=UPI000C087DE1|nr:MULTISPECIES: DNA double-strand break repair nuclease NurA [Bacillaceae]UTR06533.1 DNA double-strand break repair nuclease NurA [Alkalihalobacillus sp. LMS6]